MAVAMSIGTPGMGNQWPTQIGLQPTHWRVGTTSGLAGMQTKQQHQCSLTMHPMKSKRAHTWGWGWVKYLEDRSTVTVAQIHTHLCKNGHPPTLNTRTNKDNTNKDRTGSHGMLVVLIILLMSLIYNAISNVLKNG